MMKSLFLETSAILAILFQEADGQVALQRLNQSDYLVASRLIHIEVDRALIRLALDRRRAERLLPDARGHLNSLWPKINMVEVNRPICDLAGRIAPESRLRSLDAIHLATFFRLREFDPRLEMLSFDRRILDEVPQN